MKIDRERELKGRFAPRLVALGPTPRTSPWRARAHPPSLQRPTCAPHIPAHGARVNWGVTSVAFENAATDPTRERRNAHSGANRSD